jgi:hypothetical protein
VFETVGVDVVRCAYQGFNGEFACVRHALCSSSCGFHLFFSPVRLIS